MRYQDNIDWVFLKGMIAVVVFIVILLIGVSTMTSTKASGDTCHIDRLILKKALIQSYEFLTQKQPDIERTLYVIEHAADSTGIELP